MHKALQVCKDRLAYKDLQVLARKVLLVFRDQQELKVQQAHKV